MERRKSSAKGSLKIILGDKTKRLNNVYINLLELKEDIRKLYEIELKYVSDFSLFYSIKNSKIYIGCENDFDQFLTNQLLIESFSVHKIYIEINTDPTHVDDISAESELLFKTAKSNKSDISPNDELIEEIVEKHLKQFENNMNKFLDEFTLLPSESILPIKNQVFNIPCNICEKYLIEGEAYICIICDDLYACSNCERDHDHPLIKLKSNEFNSKSDIVRLMLGSKSSNQNTFKNLITTNLIKIKEEKIHIVLDMEVNYFIIKPNTEFTINMRIKNDSMSVLQGGGVIFAKNCGNLVVQSYTMDSSIEPGEYREIELICHSKFIEKEYSVQLEIFHKDCYVEFTPFKIKINVTSSIKTNLPNTPMTYDFNPDDTVSTLPNEKKEVICEIIRRNISIKDIFEICKILDKHQWKLTDEAIKEIQ